MEPHSNHLIINITIEVTKRDRTEWYRLLQRLEAVPMATEPLLGYGQGEVFMLPERVIKAQSVFSFVSSDRDE